jgi:hypothetical protein
MSTALKTKRQNMYQKFAFSTYIHRRSAGCPLGRIHTWIWTVSVNKHSSYTTQLSNCSCSCEILTSQRRVSFEMWNLEIEVADSSETLVPPTELHSAPSQKTAILIFIFTLRKSESKAVLVLKHHAKITASLTSKLDGGQWPVSCSARFNRWIRD